MNKRSLTILEVIWILIGALCIFAAIHNSVNDGGSKMLMLLGMALLSFGMAYIRHRQRKKKD